MYLLAMNRKVKAAQKLWNTKDPGVPCRDVELMSRELTITAETVVKAYTEDTVWRNRDQFFQGRETAKEFLTKKWQREHFYM
jgi:nuclear transport factor 2 (NTF2) superfamily protein